jgi:hypothetical protein
MNVRNELVFYPGKPFHPSLMFVGKAKNYHLSGAPLHGRLIALPTNIKLGWISLPGTNTLAYYEYS